MNAQIFSPFGVFVSNNEIFIADTENHCIRKVLHNGQIVTLCGIPRQSGTSHDGQPTTSSKLHSPKCVLVSSSHRVYISEEDGHCVKCIDQNGIISTICGMDGNGTFNGDDQLAKCATLRYPHDLYMTDDDELLIADCGNHRVRKIDQFGRISTIAGNGNRTFNGDGQLAIHAAIDCPTGVCKYKQDIYIVTDNRIRKVDENGIISTICGTGVPGYNGDDQPANQTLLNYPQSISVTRDGIFFTDRENQCVRKILPNGAIQTIAGTGTEDKNGVMATDVALEYPSGLFVDETSGVVYFSECYGNRIRRVDEKGVIWNVAGTGESGYSGDVEFDFEKCPHVGPKRKQWMKLFVKAYHDITFRLKTQCSTLVCHVSSGGYV